MKFEEPKTRTGNPLLGVYVSYYANNALRNRWYLNSESVPVEKISNLLGYKSKSQFSAAVLKYGVALIMTKGLDKIRESNNGS